METVDIRLILKKIQEKQKIAHLKYLKYVRENYSLRKSTANQEDSNGAGKGTDDKSGMGLGPQTALLFEQVQHRGRSNRVESGRGNINREGYIFGKFQGNPDFRQKKVE